MPLRTLAFAYLGWLTAAGALLPACASHGSKTVVVSNGLARGVTVTGSGKATGKPDIARTTIGVETRAASAEEAVSDVNARMARVIIALKQLGVAEADLRTSTVSINFERNPEPPRPLEQPNAAASKVAPPPAQAPAAPAGFYVATNNVEVTVRDLGRAGQVLSGATSAGANQTFGIRFELEDPAPLLGVAREKAVADARARAEKLARLAGVKLGKAVSITELDGGHSGPMPAYAMMRSDAAASAPVERGELTIQSSVQILYTLDDD